MKLTSLTWATIAAMVMYSCTVSNDANSSSPNQPDLAGYLQFPPTLSATTPYDVDTDLQAQLNAEKKFDQVQRLFDILSWQMFISLNWPTDANGLPAPTITGDGDPIWYGWKESFEVFREDGSEPSQWGSFDPPSKAKLGETKSEKILFRTNKLAEFKHDHTVDELDQAFTAPIYDQSGNVVRYEVRMNKVEFDYIVKNGLYNFDGQIEFYKKNKDRNKVVEFPSGNRSTEGVFEIKVAWKIMEPGVDSPDRYFTAQAQVANEDGTFSTQDVGMIGMHISTKTVSAPQWIWTTFEHVDNLETNPLEEVNGKPLRPSFYDTDCPTCPVNALPADVNGKKKNQIQRMLPIPMSNQALNQQVRQLLASAGSKLQYYQQIGTQWPTQPTSPPYTRSDTSTYTLPEAVTNKSGGMPTPMYLTNMIMETYFQGGTIVGDTFKIKESYLFNGKSGYEDTLSGYNVYNANEPAFFQIQGAPVLQDVKNTHMPIFGTESCVGCHFSGSIAKDYTLVDGKKTPVFARPMDADFSWLLQLKPSFEKTSSK